ncbi:hypothetical protein RR48_05206 [Papilio machaon]|uniref:FLYWCH-type domain-containing protein n=1 Tax=Papilio machaon TaxID=76193 RepID=A0A0N0PC77_PAPMA|nr:hypothetical protein RR48_05206 [Papilio machaon]
MHKGYTYYQHVGSRMFYCSKRKSGCLARIKLGKDETIRYKFIPSSKVKGKQWILCEKYTYAQHMYGLLYYCTRKNSGCKARIKLNKHGNVTAYDPCHLHEPPLYYVTSKGKYVKL